jgi:hypothetical protein
MTADRVEALEWQVVLLQRRLKVLLLLLSLCTAALGFLWHRQQSPIVEARMFVLKDDHGRVAAVLTVTPEPIAPPEGYAPGVFARPYSFTVWDGHGRERVTFGYRGVKECQ